jgi:hypothetical protein
MKVASSSSQEAAPASAELRSLEISSAAGMSSPPWDELRELIAVDEMSDVLALHEALAHRAGHVGAAATATAFDPGRRVEAPGGAAAGR